MNHITLVAIGGNSIIKDNDHQSLLDQESALKDIAECITDLVEEGKNIVLTHGNGPQVGLELRRAELAVEYENIPEVPLVNCVANTQGGMGYQLQQALLNEFTRRKLNKQVVTVITQVEVSSDDLGFLSPNKPIGTFLSLEQKIVLQQLHPDWKFIEDSGRGYRRVVASPHPLRIVEVDIIKSLIEQGVVVIALGGGGIPVIKTQEGLYQGIDAVIDKDLGTALLAEQLHAETLIITTGVEKVCINFGKSNQQALDSVPYNIMQGYMEEGHFPPGSMQPKIEASLSFIKSSGGRVIITTPEKLLLALQGKTGTHILPESIAILE